MANRLKQQELADALFPDSITSLEDSILDIPPEQRKLQTNSYDFSISTIISYLEESQIYVPEFQRKYVWTDVQASRLIESLIIQCPIPIIYLNQESDERLSVIDGNQRLTSIIRFYNNEFALSGLTTYPELADNTFEDLDERFQRHILNRVLRCIIISKDTHPQIKFDVFERLNSGAVQLNPQELRHGLYHGSLMIKIESLNHSTDWKKTLKTNDKRMKGEELILRFFAFLKNGSEYKKPLLSFMNGFAEECRNINDEDFGYLQAKFLHTISLVSRIFGDLAFKIFNAELLASSGFNAALFDATMISISQSNIDDSKIENNKNQFLKTLAKEFSNDQFYKSISRATSDENSVKTRIQIMTKLIGDHFS